MKSESVKREDVKRERGIGYLSGERLERLVQQLQEDPNVLAVFLFGSQVDGYATPESDVDLAVLFERGPSLQEELDLGVSVCEALGTEKVDLINLNRAHLLLRHRAISGRVLYERDPIRVSDFIEETILHYIDYEPDLRAFYQDYDQALEEAYGIRPAENSGSDSVH